MKEATDFINADKRKGAEIYLKVSGEKTTVDDIMEVLADQAIMYNNQGRRHRRVRRLHGQARHAEESAADWRDMFFPEAFAAGERTLTSS
jgi:NitT/TauT family transport system substrate-binding protein